MDQLTNKKPSPPARQRGFSIIEIMIAMAIGLMVIPAVFAASMGDQASILGGETNAEAVTKAQQLLEEEQALGRQDFNLVNPQASTTEGIYTKSITVETQPDFLTKKVTTNISWLGDRGQPLSTTLTSLVTNLENINSPDTCNSVLDGDWSNPILMNPSAPIDFSPNTLTGVAVSNNIAYITGHHTGLHPDLLTVDVTDPTNPVLLQSLNTGPGLTAVAIAGNYAYVANRSVMGQLQVIDISNPSAPWLVIAKKVASAGGVGNAIFYYNKHIYLGLTAVGGGPQFVMYDVTTPTNPIAQGVYTIGHDVNAIKVRGQYAYVVTADPEELKIFDVSDTMNPLLVGGSGVLPDTTANGESVYGVGNTLYVGRSVGLSPNANQLYQFDITNPALDPLPVIGTPQDVNASVNGLLVRSHLVFFTTHAQFQVRPLSNVASVFGSLDLSLVGGSPQGAFVCVGNLFYVGVLGANGGDGHDVLKIIGPGP